MLSGHMCLVVMVFKTLLAGMKIFITGTQNSHEEWGINDMVNKVKVKWKVKCPDGFAFCQISIFAHMEHVISFSNISIQV